MRNNSREVRTKMFSVRPRNIVSKELLVFIQIWGSDESHSKIRTLQRPTRKYPIVLGSFSFG